jgi:hypothetical protein
MEKSVIRRGGPVLVLLLAAAGILTAQDFQRTYPLDPGGRISVQNVSGGISLTGENRRDVLVLAFKEGPDRDLVQVEDESSADRILVRALYPQNARCDASIRFEVHVPSGLELNIDSLSNASGDILVRAVRGNLRARTASGNVTVEQAEGTVHATSASGDVSVQGVSGIVNAQTASGDVDVELVEQGTGAEMKFSSASGDVTVKAPANLNAEVQMSTASGKLSSDFPLTVEDGERGPGRKAFGRLGSGSCLLKISTASGNVNLVH